MQSNYQTCCSRGPNSSCVKLKKIFEILPEKLLKKSVKKSKLLKIFE